MSDFGHSNLSDLSGNVHGTAEDVLPVGATSAAAQKEVKTCDDQFSWARRQQQLLRFSVYFLSAVRPMRLSPQLP